MDKGVCIAKQGRRVRAPQRLLVLLGNGTVCSTPQYLYVTTPRTLFSGFRVVVTAGGTRQEWGSRTECVAPVPIRNGCCNGRIRVGKG